ncbi:Clp protease N-terminal domain-containing protein [Candidatus Saccharibacteria bacterium]|nr:Clp protease N-terminal domain-containing protein [Candidatus Saccharibacteria bacterium]
MPKNFNEPALCVLRNADKEASEVLKRNRVGNECLLTALTKDEGDVGKVLRGRGLKPERAEHGFLCLFGEGDFVHSAKKPFTRAADENLRRAAMFADDYGLIEPVHLALALFRNVDEPITRLLSFLKIDKDEILDALNKIEPSSKRDPDEIDELEAQFNGDPVSDENRVPARVGSDVGPDEFDELCNGELN